MKKVAMVTGSTNNVGKGIAEVLSEEGFLVIVTSRHVDEAKAIANKLPVKGVGYEVDFSDAEQIAGLFSFVKEKYGRLDVLVNNVAFTLNESILDCTLENWEYTMNTNLRSYYLCTKYGAEMMKVLGGGNVVNITVSRTTAVNNKFSYMVTKGAIHALTLNAAVDLAPFNIRVNAVGIGPTGTPVGSKDYPNRKRKPDSPGTPAGHAGNPRDIGYAVSFLISEKARFIYGANLTVDGGSSISRAPQTETGTTFQGQNHQKLKT